ncbi:(2E,6E)-farnesyl diphosphate synthase [Marinimicrobium locisalis]|uniref:(2E,6E)-farnesyl diphosphate synthase n=1 Tax=Marinimicrobium locisalis TaxID=546022 RepID=UPI0032217F0D
MSPEFDHYARPWRSRFEPLLRQYLPQPDPQRPALAEAMAYSLGSGGKRIRPMLVYAASAALNRAPDSSLDRVALSVECLHAYSLVHDDLPAMDDDDLRRGHPTCHIAYDEATAILAGDALQALAFELLAGCETLTAAQRVALVCDLARASGASGMVLGQAIDLGAVDQQLTLTELERMHRHKTGALIRASVTMGARASEAGERQLVNLIEYAEAIGLAFQVQDDILDVTADTGTLGKRQGADVSRHKPTYVSLLGLDGARAKSHELLEQSLGALNDFGAGADALRHLARYVVERDH